MTRVVTASAREVTAREFMDALGLSSPEERAERRAQLYRQCIAAIERRDTYGWPPMLVTECRKLMETVAEPLTETHGDPLLAKNRRAG